MKDKSDNKRAETVTSPSDEVIHVLRHVVDESTVTCIPRTTFISNTVIDPIDPRLCSHVKQLGKTILFALRIFFFFFGTKAETQNILSWLQLHSAKYAQFRLCVSYAAVPLGVKDRGAQTNMAAKRWRHTALATRHDAAVFGCYEQLGCFVSITAHQYQSAGRTSSPGDRIASVPEHLWHWCRYKIV
jgi:hypothetical protein